MKSVFQARSTMVRSPALQPPSSKRHFLRHEESLNIRKPKVQVQKFHCPRRGGWKFVLGLIVFGLLSGCNYSETSSKNHKALVWFGQTYDMKLEHDDWEPCSLRSSTNKIIFSQICVCLFFSFSSEVINQQWYVKAKGWRRRRLVFFEPLIPVLKRVKCAWLSWSNPVVQVSLSPSLTREKEGERERAEREWWPLTGLNRGFHARDQTPSLFSTLSLRRKTRAPPSDLSPFFLKGV